MSEFSYEEAFGKAPVKAKVIPQSPEFGYEEAFNVKYEPRSELSMHVGAAGAASQAVAKEAASIGDMILNTPTSIVGIGGNVARRLGGILSGEDRKASAMAGRQFQEQMEATAPNLLKRFVGLFSTPEDAGGETHVEKAMGAVIDWTDRDAASIEERTKGAIKKEDIQLLRDTALSVLGMQGITKPMKALGKKLGETPPVEILPEPAKAPPPEATPITPPLVSIEKSTGVADVAERTTKKAIASRRAEIRQAFAEDPQYADYMRNLVEEDIRQADLTVTRGQRLYATEGVLPKTNLPEATILKSDGTVDSSLVMQRSLDTGLAKVVKGQSFTLTPEEMIAIRGNAKSWGGLIEKGAADPDLLAIMAVAGVGTALAVAYPDEAKDLAATAAGAGLFFTGSLRDFSKMSDASPMSALLANSTTTLKTFERLPQNHSIYKKTLIEEQLKRPDVTKAEKEVIQTILDDTPGDTITPKELIVGFKKETNAWELKKQPTDEFAEYGIENIGRNPWDFVKEGPPDESTVPGIGVFDLKPSEIAAETHVWRLPDYMQMDEGNHFQDPQYFGHTRVFKENGVRHVIEIQSDLAQKVGKVLTPDEYNGLLKEAEKYAEKQKVFNEDFYVDKPFDVAVKGLLETLDKIDPGTKARFSRDLDADLIKGIYEGRFKTSAIEQWIEREAYYNKVSIAEVTAKLNAGGINSQIGPIIKNWPKRLIREELADAKGSGESTVRFATADTVAKVEGWPDRQRTFDRTWGDYYLQQIKRPEQRFSPEHQGIYDRYDRDITKFLEQLGGEKVVDELGHTWIEVPTSAIGKRTQMLGRADLELVKTLGAAGAGAVIGAYLAGKEDVTGATLGAVGGLLGRYGASKSLRIRRGVEAIAKGADYAGGLVSTRVKNISEPIHHRLVEHERQIFREGHKNLTVVAPFIEKLGEVSRADRPNLNAAILTNDPTVIRDAMQKTKVPGLYNEWTNVRGLLDQLGKENVASGLLKNLRKDYFPRVVRDVEGLLNQLGAEQKTFLEKKLANAESLSQRTSGQSLSPEERSAIINEEFARAPIQGGGRASFRKPRTIEEVTKELLPYYDNPIDSLTGYIRASSREQAKAKFFGRDLVKEAENGVETVNIDKSVGALVDRELLGKNISGKDAEMLKDLIRSRFVGGEKASSAIVQDIKNLGYTSLLGHPTSALVQLSDVGQTVFTQGLMPTVEGAVVMLRGKGVSAKDFGLLDHVAEELASTRGTAKVLNETLKWVGFTGIDKFGKSNALTAAKIRYEKLAKTAKGQKEIIANYGEAFGEDVTQLISDLRTKKQSDLVDSLLFHELSRQQPISKIEVPQAYLDNPNARAVYMLKTFMLKQVDLARRDGYNEIKKGNITKGTKALIGLGLLWGASGAVNSWVRDWILGKTVDPKVSDITDNMLKTFGWSDYVFDKAKQGKPVQAALGTLMPPVSIIDDTLSTAQKMASGAVKKPSDLKGVQNVPIVGRLIYNRALGGAEEADKKRKAKERRDERRRRAELRRTQ